VECGLQLLARLSHYRVYLTAEERTKHRSSETGEIDRRVKSEKDQRFFLFDGSGNGSTNSQRSLSRESLPLGSIDNLDHTYAEEYSTSYNLWNCIPLMFGKGRKNKVYATRRRGSDTSDTTKEEPDAIDLELHIALSCGDITNVILGDMDSSENSRPNSPTTAKKRQRFSYVSTNGSENPIDNALYYTGRLEYAICGPAVESLEDALSAAKAGEMSITPDAYHIFRKQSMNLFCEKRNQFYVVKNADTTTIRKGTRSTNTKGLSVANANYLASRPGLVNRAATLNIEPLIPRTRDTSYLELSSDPNPNYLKYINRSAIYRLENSPDDNFIAQFRDATIMFISLGKLNVATAEGVKIAQKATLATIQTLVKYEGMKSM
jgi:hypothetical protein